MNNAQNKISEFINSNNMDCDVTTRLLDLLSELGEVSKEIIKSTNYGQNDFKNNDKFKEELGDLYFSLLALANKSERY